MAAANKLNLLVVPDDRPNTVTPYLEGKANELADQVVIHRDMPSSHAALIERCKDADGIVNILATSQFSRDLMEASPKLRIISLWAAGVNNVDLEAAKSLGITVSNTPGYGSIGVGEHTLTLMMAVARNVTGLDRSIRDGNWPKQPLTELYGKTLGVVGGGPIAQRVMELGRLLGMKVVAWTLHPSPERAAQYQVEFVALDDLCRHSDFIAVIIALSERTEKVIGHKQMDLMKPEAILVNTGRGALIDEEALVEVLRQKRIGGAGLDVFVNEPLPAGHPLTQLDNVVLSSHVAAHTPETTTAGVKMALDNVSSFLAGSPTNVFVQGSR
ncbi:MAG: 2-hydroxyacid dehydrogenase [Dehalococcoidia bacterium]